MSDMGCPYKILIADGGDDVSVERNLKKYTNYPNIVYQYIRYPYDKDSSCYYNKLSDVVSKVDSKYILFADNDDFFILNNIPNYIQFLDENTDFVSCGSPHCALEILAETNEAQNMVQGKRYLLSKQKYISRTIEYDFYLDRVLYFFKHVDQHDLWMSYYYIHRTGPIKRIVNYLKIHKFSDFVGYEIFLLTAMLMQGKSKELPGVCYIRQTGSSETTALMKYNLIERLIKTNSFTEIMDGLEYLFDCLKKSEKNAILRAYSFWFANHACGLYVFSASSIFFDKLYKILAENEHKYISFTARRLHSYYVLMLKKRSRKFIKLPLIEKYIIE